MFVNFKNDRIAEASMEKFSVPIERGVNARVQSKHRETQQINEKNNGQVDIKSEILAVEPCIDRKHQNKSFCCNFHPPKSLSEHVRRRGDVNWILTHAEGENGRHLLPPCPEFSRFVKKALQMGWVLAVVRAPPRQLSRQDSQKLPYGLSPPAIADSPGSQAIS